MHLGGGRVMLLLEFLLIVFLAHPLGLRRRVVRAGPHLRRVRFIIPHRVAEVGVQEDVRLVHVAGHALRGRDRAREGVADRVARFEAFLLYLGLRSGLCGCGVDERPMLVGVGRVLRATMAGNE